MVGNPAFSYLVGDPAFSGFSLINRKRRQGAGVGDDGAKACNRDHCQKGLVESQLGDKHQGFVPVMGNSTADRRCCSVRLSPKIQVLQDGSHGRAPGRRKGL